MQWLRWYHGTAADMKFGRIARTTGQTRERVVFVWAMLLESASDNEQRGTFDIEADDIADILHCATGDIDAIVTAMRGAGMIDGNALCAWERRQPARDDSATRQRRKRDRDAPPVVPSSDGDAGVTRTARDSDAHVTPPDTETDTDTEKQDAVPIGTGVACAPPPVAPVVVEVPDIPIAMQAHHARTPDSIRGLIFGAGLSYVSANSDKAPEKLRPWLGKLCRDHGDPDVLAALASAQRDTPVDPIAWIERKLHGKRTDSGLSAFAAAASEIAAGR